MITSKQILREINLNQLSIALEELYRKFIDSDHCCPF